MISKRHLNIKPMSRNKKLNVVTVVVLLITSYILFKLYDIEWTIKEWVENLSLIFGFIGAITIFIYMYLFVKSYNDEEEQARLIIRVGKTVAPLILLAMTLLLVSKQLI